MGSVGRVSEALRSVFPQCQCILHRLGLKCNNHEVPHKRTINIRKQTSCWPYSRYNQPFTLDCIHFHVVIYPLTLRESPELRLFFCFGMFLNYYFHGQEWTLFLLCLSLLSVFKCDAAVWGVLTQQIMNGRGNSTLLCVTVLKGDCSNVNIWVSESSTFP